MKNITSKLFKKVIYFKYYYAIVRKEITFGIPTRNQTLMLLWKYIGNLNN